MKLKIEDIMKKQFELHKDIQMQDIYKLIYQGTFGCEHLAHDGSMDMLYKEFDEAEPDKDESLIEVISPDYMIYRLNIRCFKHYSDNKKFFFEWFYNTSKMKLGSEKDFINYWDACEKYLEDTGNELLEEVKDFREKACLYDLRRWQFMTMHHSEKYKKANNPSYRVVHRKAAVEAIKGIAKK